MQENQIICFTIISAFPLIGGWGNGYVAVHPGHPYYGKHYDEISGVDVHGGLTYSAPYNAERDPIEAQGCWVFGFDTAHAYDSLDNWPDAESVLAEAQRLKIQFEAVSTSL